MRKARYNLRQTVCPKSSCIGYSSNVAKPGYWIAYDGGIARVLGQIEECPYDGGVSVKGWIVAIRLIMECTHAGVTWIDPQTVTHCYSKPPADLLTWFTGDEWVKNKGDIARIIAMGEHGTLSDSFISTRNDPDKPYNSRPAYVAQFILP